MFAAPVVKPQAKAAGGSSDKSAQRRATVRGQEGDTEQDPTSRAEPHDEPRGPNWDFSKIPVYPAQRLPSPVQRKLEVGAVNDPLEHEANRVADQVMRIPDAGVSVGAAQPQISRKSEAGTPAAISEAPASVHEVLRAPGEPLDAATRGFFEPRFRRDFSSVRVHADPLAAQSARSINARAYTAGDHIVFGEGQFAPPTQRRMLLAHELTHVAQQGGTAAAVQRAPINPLTALTGESDIYAAPISDRPAERMSKSEVDDEINRLERWIGKQNQSTPDVIKRENRLADLRLRQTELGAPVKARRATPVVAVKPRCLTEALDITQMTRAEMAAELDSIVQFLRLGPSKSDIAKVTHFKNALEQALQGQREQENEEVRKRDIALALQPITTGNTYEDFKKVLTVIASITPDPNNTEQAALHLPNGMTVPVSKEEAIALKTQSASIIKRYAAQSEILAEDTYEAFEERRQKGKEHPIVHGLVKWAADVDDLGELEMFGKKEQARGMQAQIKGLVNRGNLISAFTLAVSLDALSEGYARQVGEWEAALMNSAGRWVLGLTVLKEGLTLLATAGAGSLINSARTARGISALRATVEVAGATTFAGSAGGFGGYAASEKLTGGEVTWGGAGKAARVGGGTGFAIGAAPGAVGAAREAFGVGRAVTTVGNVGRGVAAEFVGNVPVNVAAAGIQGESMKDAAISTAASSTISGAGGQLVTKLAKGSKIVTTAAGTGLGGTAGVAGALATGQDTRGTILAGAFGTAGGALGPHLEESNKKFLEGRSRGSSTEGASEPPTTDSRFDFSDTPLGGARSGGSAPPAESGVSGKFDLSDVGGSPPADPGSGPNAVTTGTTGGSPTSSATSVTSESTVPALTGSRRTSFGGPNEPPLPADVDIEGAVDRIGPAKDGPSGPQSSTGYSRSAPPSEDVIGSAPGRARRGSGSIHRGKARPFYAKDPKGRTGSRQPSAKRQTASDLASLTNKLEQMAGVLPEGPLLTEINTLKDKARNMNEQFKAGMLQHKEASNKAQSIAAELEQHSGASPVFDELMQMTPQEIEANQVRLKSETARAAGILEDENSNPLVGEASTPNKASQKETGNQQEKRLFAEDRASGRPRSSQKYHAYEGKNSGSFRQWADRLQRHIDTAFKRSANKPQINTDPLAKLAPEGTPKSTAEGTAHFIDRHPDLKASFDQLRLSTDMKLAKLQAMRSAARGDRAALNSIDKVAETIEMERAEVSKIERGVIGDLRPDLVEVFFKNQFAVVTDITQRTGDPLHNFKTELYVEIVKEVLGWTDVHGVNFNNVFDQNVN